MKKYTIQDAADLLKAKTHAIYADTNDFEKLRKILKSAYPNDVGTDTYGFNTRFYYGSHIKYNNIWADIGDYLKQLQTINLSEILNPTLSEISNISVVDVETVTISKADYDRFLKIEAVINQIKNI